MTAPPAPSPSPPAPPSWWLPGVLAGFVLLGVALYRGALTGPLISDDYGYLVSHPYLAAVTLEGLLDIWNPWGQARYFAANFAPVHLSAHLLERLAFGTWTPGYHLVNVLVHALNASLLLKLLLDAGLARRAALAGGLFFLVHPANVEAVAWISQLKTSGALALALGALVARPRSAWLGLLLFGLALLTKATAVAALPMAAAAVWARREARSAWLPLAGWALLFGLYCLPQLSAHDQAGFFAVDAFANPWVQLRTVAALGARYLVMAASGIGVGAFQDPPPALDPLDPWWLASLPAGGWLLWRIAVSLRARSPEAGFWLGAAAGFAPVSQLLPFLYPFADRYLYFILPGLIGGSAFALRAAARRVGAGSRARLAAGALAVGICALFANASHSRAFLWQGEDRLVEESARLYPDGESARWQKTCAAGRRGDLGEVLARLRATGDRGASRFESLFYDACFEPLRSDPAFQSFAREAAGGWLATAYQVDIQTQAMLRAMAQAHRLRDERRKARDLYLEAIALGGPLTPRLRKELRALREEMGEIRGRRREDARRERDPAPPAPRGAR